MEWKRFPSKRKNLFIVLACLSLNSCAISLGDTSETEIFESRPATKKEAASLKQCLTAIYKEQKNYFKIQNRYLIHTKDLHVDEACQDIQVGLRGDKTSYQAIAKIRQDQTEVTWMIDESGKIQQKQAVF